jgi:protein-disulfide isomerase
MASRKDQKEAARAARMEQEREAAAAAGRRRRLQILGSVVAVAVVVVVVAIALSTGSSSSGSTSKLGSSADKLADQRVHSLLAGIPEQPDNVLGRASAPVTITEYGDLECSICDELALGAGQASPDGVSEGYAGTGLEDKIIQKYVRTGKAKLVFDSLETASSGSPIPNVFPTQQAAAYAAGLQGKAWYYIELFYSEQGREDTGYATTSFLDDLAKQVPGLNYAEWSRDRTKPSLIAQVNRMNSAGTALDTAVPSSQGGGGASTPTFVVSGPKGTSAPVIGIPANPPWLTTVESDIAKYS